MLISLVLAVYSFSSKKKTYKEERFKKALLEYY